MLRTKARDCSTLGSTSDLVGFIHETEYKDIPKEAIEKVKLQIFDYLGVTLA